MSRLHFFCAACQRKSREKLCDSCRDELDELRIARRAPRMLGDWPLTSLYEYEGIVRQLVLRAKVKMDHAALKLLVELALEAKTLRIPQGALLMPCPSSLWSRLRGRLDIPAHIAHGLTKRDAKATLLCSPYDLHWRLQKRARQGSRRERGLAQNDAPPKPNAAGDWLAAQWCKRHAKSCADRRILILDDVVTTGKTLIQTATRVRALADPQAIHLTVFASAL